MLVVDNEITAFPWVDEIDNTDGDKRDEYTDSNDRDARSRDGPLAKLARHSLIKINRFEPSTHA